MTCLDNRIYTWDGLGARGSCEWAGSGGGAAQPSLPPPPPPPSTATIHSHDFARFLSPFRAVWYPPDARERALLCGRFISDSFTTRAGARIKLHPIDMIDCGPARGLGCSSGINSGSSGGGSATGRTRVLAQLAHPLVPTISPVLACHES